MPSQEPARPALQSAGLTFLPSFGASPLQPAQTNDVYGETEVGVGEGPGVGDSTGDAVALSGAGLADSAGTIDAADVTDASGPAVDVASIAWMINRCPTTILFGSL